MLIAGLIRSTYLKRGMCKHPIYQIERSMVLEDQTVFKILQMRCH